MTQHQVQEPAGSAGAKRVMSARVRPEVERGYRDIVEATGLSYDAILDLGLELVRRDEAIRALVEARRAWDEHATALERRMAAARPRHVTRSR